MSLTVVDNPPDRPEWIKETTRLVTAVAADGRRSLLHLVEETTDPAPPAGTPGEWGLGQIAVHFLIVDRGVSLIALRLARGDDPPGNTSQPRPAPSGVTRDGIRSLADKAAAVADRLRAELPAAPDASRTAVHPFLRPRKGPDRRSWARCTASAGCSPSRTTTTRSFPRTAKGAPRRCSR